MAINRKKQMQINNTLEAMGIEIRSSENIMKEYEGSYSLYQLDLMCDRLEAKITDLRDLIASAQAEENNY